MSYLLNHARSLVLSRHTAILKGGEYGKSIVFLIQAAANFGQRSKPSSPVDLSHRAEEVIAAFCFCLSPEMLQLLASGVATDVSTQVVVYLNDCVLAWQNSLLIAAASELMRHADARLLVTKYYLALSKAIIGASVVIPAVDLCRLTDQVLI